MCLASNRSLVSADTTANFHISMGFLSTPPPHAWSDCHVFCLTPWPWSTNTNLHHCPAKSTHYRANWRYKYTGILWHVLRIILRVVELRPCETSVAFNQSERWISRNTRNFSHNAAGTSWLVWRSPCYALLYKLFLIQSRQKILPQSMSPEPVKIRVTASAKQKCNISIPTALSRSYPYTHKYVFWLRKTCQT
jgi:hypothetical protein